MKKRKKKLK